MNQIRLQQQQQSPCTVCAPFQIPLVTYRLMALHSIISVLKMRPSTEKMNVTQSLKYEMRKVNIQIAKQCRKDENNEEVYKDLEGAREVVGGCEWGMGRTL